MFNSSEVNLPLNMSFACTESGREPDLLNGKTRSLYCALLLFVRRGALRACLNDTEMSLQAGEVLIICPGMTFSLTAGENGEKQDLAMIYLDPDQLADTPAYIPGLKGILAEVRKRRMPLRLNGEEAGEIPFQMEACLLEEEKQNYGWDLAVTSRLYLICTALIRFWRGKGLTMPTRRNAEEPILSVTAYINRHVQDGLRVEDLAENCGLSYPWFAKKFRQAYGVNCKDFIEQIRVNQVGKYLLFTDMGLEEISQETGYADCSHMIKNFKRIMGITPGQFRLRHR